MRHTISIKASSQIKNGSLTYYLPNMQDGECVRLTQGTSQIFLIYRVTESMGRKQAEVNEYLLSLNGLESDANSLIQPYSPRALEHLIVEVSELDWKIINLNQTKVAECFLQQISVVWANAQIPIYYDDMNFVVLRALCDNIYRLNINTTVEFIERKEREGENKSESESQQQPLEKELTLFTEDQNERNGYLNRVFINRELKDNLVMGSEFWIVENRLEFRNLPTISELLILEKQRTDEKNGKTYEAPSSKKLVLLQADENLAEDRYSCSKQCRQLLGLSERIYLSNLQLYKPAIQTLSLQIFFNDPNLSINLIRLQSSIEEIKQQSSNRVKAEVEEVFAHHLLNVLFNRKQFHILQQEYPYRLEKQLFIIMIVHKKDNKYKDKLYKLAYIGKESPEKKEEYFKKLVAGKVNFITQSQNFLHEKYELISRWIKVIQQNQDSRSASSNQENQLAIEKTFSIIYEEEIKKVIQFIIPNNFSEKVCSISSYGSNGKTFIHEFLKRKGHRMWKINFRELNSPQLSFKQIDFYLEWIFANTPFQTIYLDDFDSLCSKVDDGDQLRKGEKKICKLILRKINRYVQLYGCKLIVTAKSDSNLDEELAKHINITLKNPNRQLRLLALTALSERIYEESPIKKIQFQEEKLAGERIDKVSERELQDVVEGTESLTFGAFMKHAVGFTKPKNITSIQVYDFTKIAGLKVAKSTIKNIIEKPIKYSFLFKTVPIKLPRGILLYGATGNGKSALGLAVKDEFKMKYFSVKGSDILSKYIGGSEAAVRDIFQKALSVSPSIIFFDEFESIVPKRSANNTGVNDRIVNQFLCYLDGVSAISGVYIIASSSRPDLIDPAVLRPGRLDAHLFLDYPQLEQRQELIKLFQKSIKIEVQDNQIIDKTASFSYSDLIGLFKELRIKRSAEVLKCEDYKPEDFIKISRELFEQTLENFKLSVNPEQQKRQRKVYINFKEGVSPDIKAQKQIQY